LVRSTM